VQDDARAGDRNKCARMEHFGSVVRDFGSLSMVKPRRRRASGRGVGRQSGCPARPSRGPPAWLRVNGRAAWPSGRIRRVQGLPRFRPPPVRCIPVRPGWFGAQSAAAARGAQHASFAGDPVRLRRAGHQSRQVRWHRRRRRAAGCPAKSPRRAAPPTCVRRARRGDRASAVPGVREPPRLHRDRGTRAASSMRPSNAAAVPGRQQALRPGDGVGGTQTPVLRPCRGSCPK
jgi:hypothetical protein